MQCHNEKYHSGAFRRGRRRNSSGFTLAEMLAALVVMGLLVLMLLWSFQRIRASRGYVNEWSRTMDEVRYLMRLIEGDFRNIYRGDEDRGDSVYFSAADSVGTEETIGPVFGISQPSTRFMRWDRVRVNYHLSRPNHGQKRLFLRRCRPEDATGLDPKETVDMEQVWVGLKEMRFFYFDGDVWQKSWHEETTLPQAVRVELVYAGEGFPPAGWSCRKTVYLHPLAGMVAN